MFGIEQRTELVADRGAAGGTVAAEQGLGPLEDGRVDDPCVLAVVDLVLVAHLPRIGDVGDQLVEAGPGKPLRKA